MKYRAIRLDHGNFSWGSEGRIGDFEFVHSFPHFFFLQVHVLIFYFDYIVCSRKVRVVDVVYNATSNELVRTKTLVKGAIIQVC